MNRLIGIGCLAVIMGLLSCYNKTQREMEPAEVHEIAVHLPGKGMIYVDRMSSNKVLNVAETGENNFHTYRVGFIDSLLAKQQDADPELNNYYQFRMANDWVALVNGDSLRPVYHQPEPKRIQQDLRGVIVFDLPRNEVPDSLIFLDSKNIWGIQKLSLKN
jgi:hypothetical protein